MAVAEKRRASKRPRVRRVVKPNENAKPMTLAHFKAWCLKLKLENGQPLIIEPFQDRILGPYFAGVVETAVVLPKKNGKSSLVGALALYVLLHTNDAEVIMAAAAKTQASKMFEFAAGFVRRTPWLQKHLKIQRGYLMVIRQDGDGGYIKVIAADAKTVDGMTPTLALVDEYHRHTSSELYGILRDGCSARAGQLISISTAGDSEESPLGVLRETAHAMPGFVRQGAYCHAADDEGSFEWHEWALDEDADVEDFRLVKQANPLSIHTAASLGKRFRSPSMQPWQWARFTCGIWSSGEFAALDVSAIILCAKGGHGLEPGESCWMGMDVGWRRDTTALVPFVLDLEDDVQVVGKSTIIKPPGDGTDLHPDVILAAIRKVHERNPIEAIVFDPRAEGRNLAVAIGEELGIRVVEHSQDPSPMADAAMGLAEDLRATKVVLPEDDRELLVHLKAAGAQSVKGGTDRWRFVKTPGGRCIDAAVALAMVRHARIAETTKRKKRLTLADYGMAA